MNVTYTFRDIEATDGLRNLAADKIKKLETFLTEGAELHVILETEHDVHRAELNLLEKNLKTSAKAETDDMYKSIQEAVQKLSRQLRKHKERRTEHHR